MKKIQKRVFFNEHKCENVIKYWETIFTKIKLLLPYFVEFFKDIIMVPEKYLDNYAVKSLD